MKNDYYSGTYIPKIMKRGKTTLLLDTFIGFLPAPVMAFRGYMSPMFAIIAGALMQISVSGAFYTVEPISYSPILGIPDIYLTLFPGSTSNMRVSCFSAAQEAVGVEMGTKEGSIISAIGITTSILVNVMTLTVRVVVGSAILNILPASVKEALNPLLPASFGAIFKQFAATRPKLGAVTAIITTGVNRLMKLGSLSFMPGNPSCVVILVAVFSSIYTDKLLYKKEFQVD